LTHPNADDLEERIKTSATKWKNPYRDAYIWLKGELLDVQGMSNALDGREAVFKS
jgi:hypothetical protein